MFEILLIIWKRQDVVSKKNLRVYCKKPTKTGLSKYGNFLREKIRELYTIQFTKVAGPGQLWGKNKNKLQFSPCSARDWVG